MLTMIGLTRPSSPLIPGSLSLAPKTNMLSCLNCAQDRTFVISLIIHPRSIVSNSTQMVLVLLVPSMIRQSRSGIFVRNAAFSTTILIPRKLAQISLIATCTRKLSRVSLSTRMVATLSARLRIVQSRFGTCVRDTSCTRCMDTRVAQTPRLSHQAVTISPPVALTTLS